MRILGIIAAITFVADQVSKYIVVQAMDLKNLNMIEVWPPFLTYRMAWNEGVNFGLFSSSEGLMRWILIAVALVISSLVIWWVQRDKMGTLAQIAAGLLVGGALGNVIDRIVYGAVADFLNVTCCNLTNPWSFNIADIAVFTGAFGLVFFSNPPKGKKAS